MTEVRAARNEAGVLSGQLARESFMAVGEKPSANGKMRYPPVSLLKDGIPRLGFSHVGEPSEPGVHRSHYGLVDISRDDLAVWKAFPDAIFTVIQPSPYSDVMISRLGTFEV
ncbi:hypothetical protein RAD15_33690 [Bradyrhizobium sp. 14AA]